MANVRVDGWKVGSNYLLSCSVCGPLGVSPSYVEGIVTVKAHITDHGAVVKETK